MATSLALFEELASERSGREAELREELRTRPDLGEALREVLSGRAPAPPETSEVLRSHRTAMRIRLAAELLSGLEPSVAMPIVLDASHAAGDVRFAVKKVAGALLERDPSWWPKVLDPTTGFDTIRYCLANVRHDRASEVPRASLERLARMGLALDLVVPLLAIDDSGLAVVGEVLADESISGDERARAFAVIRYTPRAWEIARGIVRANTHASCPKLIESLVYAYQDAGVDVSFERGDALRVSSQDDFADMLAEWERETAGPPRSLVGFVPMHRGVVIGRDGAWSLARARNQVFVVGDKRCWHVRYESYDVDDDPNEVSLLEALDPKERVDGERLREGTYLRGTVSLALERVAPSKAHPFSEGPKPIPVRWWRGAVGPREGWSIELGLLPLHSAEGDDAETVRAYAWHMPAFGDRMPPPMRVCIYGIVLAGERALDASAERGARIDVELSFPVVTRMDETLYPLVLRALR